jgi:hypothetical protein
MSKCSQPDQHKPTRVMFETNFRCGLVRVERDYEGEMHYFVNGEEQTVSQYLSRVKTVLK